jgi:hypothetical protein
MMGYLRWGRGDNATGIQPIDFGKVRSGLGRFFPENPPAPHTGPHDYHRYKESGTNDQYSFDYISNVHM